MAKEMGKLKIYYSYLDEVSENQYNQLLHDKRVKVIGDYAFILSKHKYQVRTEYDLFVCDDTADGIYNCLLEKYDLFDKVEGSGFDLYFRDMIQSFLDFFDGHEINWGEIEERFAVWMEEYFSDPNSINNYWEVLAEVARNYNEDDDIE